MKQNNSESEVRDRRDTEIQFHAVLIDPLISKENNAVQDIKLVKISIVAEETRRFRSESGEREREVDTKRPGKVKGVMNVQNMGGRILKQQ